MAGLDESVHFVHFSIPLPAFCFDNLISRLNQMQSIRMNFGLKEAKNK